MKKIEKGNLALLNYSFLLSTQNERIPAGSIVMIVGEKVNTFTAVFKSAMFETGKENFTLCQRSSLLENKTFCLTGTLDNDRNFYIKLIELNGGTYSKTVNRNLNYLVVAYNNMYTDKALKAKSYGIKCITEQDLRKMIK